jgi:hypothetical protein
MTVLIEALRDFLIENWAVIVSLVSIGGGGFLLSKARKVATILIASLPMVVKEVMLKSLNVDEEKAKEWYADIEMAKEARSLSLQKELADIELKLGSPLLTDEQKLYYTDLKKLFIAEIAKYTTVVADRLVAQIEKDSQ